MERAPRNPRPIQRFVSSGSVITDGLETLSFQQPTGRKAYLSSTKRSEWGSYVAAHVDESYNAARAAPRPVARPASAPRPALPAAVPAVKPREPTGSCTAPPQARCAGGAACKSRAEGENAIGWQLDAYWSPDRRWYSAEVIAYDVKRGAHEILYYVGSHGGAETELACLGCSRLRVVSTTPVPLRWSFACVCGIRFDEQSGYELDSDGSCVQCYECLTWLHAHCLASGGRLDHLRAYDADRAKVDRALRALTQPGGGEGKRGARGDAQQHSLAWVASQARVRCPGCARAGRVDPPVPCDSSDDDDESSVAGSDECRPCDATRAERGAGEGASGARASRADGSGGRAPAATRSGAALQAPGSAEPAARRRHAPGSAGAPGAARARPGAEERADSDLDEELVLAHNRGRPLAPGEAWPKRRSCRCVARRCIVATSRWGRQYGESAVACAGSGCSARLHLRCAAAEARAASAKRPAGGGGAPAQPAAAAASAADGQAQFLCPSCAGSEADGGSDAPSDGARSGAESDEDDSGSEAPSEAGGAGGLGAGPGPKAARAEPADEPPPLAMSRRVALVRGPCGACWQCAHPAAYGSCARSESGDYTGAIALVPIAELQPGGLAHARFGAEAAGLLLSSITAAHPYAQRAEDARALPPSERIAEMRARYGDALLPSVCPAAVLRGVVHACARSMDDARPFEPAIGRSSTRGGAGAGAGGAARAEAASRPIDSRPLLATYFDSGVVVHLSEAELLPFTRAPVTEVAYALPAVRQLSFLSRKERRHHWPPPPKLLQQIVRREQRFGRIEVRPTTKRQGGKMVQMLGAFWTCSQSEVGALGERKARRQQYKSKVDRLNVGVLLGTYGGAVLRREDTLPEAERPAGAGADGRPARRYRGETSTCLFDLSPSITIDGAIGGNVTRYINHANSDAEANLAAHKFEVDGEVLVALVCTRAVRPGTELLYRYGDFSFHEAQFQPDGAEDGGAAAAHAAADEDEEGEEADGARPAEGGEEAGAAARAPPPQAAQRRVAIDAQPLVPPAAPPAAPLRLFGVVDDLAAAEEAALTSRAPGPLAQGGGVSDDEVEAGDPADDAANYSMDATAEAVEGILPGTLPRGMAARFRAVLQAAGECVWLGRHESAALAAKAYDEHVRARRLRLPTNARLLAAAHAQQQDAARQRACVAAPAGAPRAQAAAQPGQEAAALAPDGAADAQPAHAAAQGAGRGGRRRGGAGARGGDGPPPAAPPADVRVRILSGRGLGRVGIAEPGPHGFFNVLLPRAQPRPQANGAEGAEGDDRGAEGGGAQCVRLRKRSDQIELLGPAACAAAGKGAAAAAAAERKRGRPDEPGAAPAQPSGAGGEGAEEQGRRRKASPAHDALRTELAAAEAAGAESSAGVDGATAAACYEADFLHALAALLPEGPEAEAARESVRARQAHLASVRAGCTGRGSQAGSAGPEVLAEATVVASACLALSAGAPAPRGGQAARAPGPAPSGQRDEEGGLAPMVSAGSGGEAAEAKPAPLAGADAALA